MNVIQIPLWLTFLLSSFFFLKNTLSFVGEMLFRGTERNKCGMFRQMLKRGTDNIKSIMLRYMATVGTYR